MDERSMSVAVGNGEMRVSGRPAWGRTALARLGRESLPIVVCCTLTLLASALLSELVSTDGWRALVAGRLIAHHGLPHHDSLTLLAHGRVWVDQQWLGQLALYAVFAAGGLKLVLATNLTLVIGAFVAAVVQARRRGGA